MQDGGAHIGELAQLGKGDLGNRGRVPDDAGVRHQDAGDVSPVFVHIGIDGCRRNGAGDIATTAGHDPQPPGGQPAVEAGNHNTAAALERFGDGGVGGLAVEGAVEGEEDAVGSVNEGITEVRRHELCREVLAARDDLVHGGVLAEAAAEGSQIGGDVHGDAEFVPDAGKALLDGLEDLVA